MTVTAHWQQNMSIQKAAEGACWERQTWVTVGERASRASVEIASCTPEGVCSAKHGRH